MSYPSDEYYQSKWKIVVNVLKSQNLKVSRIAKAGSRAKQQHIPKSDMDVIFAVAGNPTKAAFYPELIQRLKNNFPNDTVYPGTNYNIIHLNFRTGGKFELILLTEQAFDAEYEDILQYKRKNL